MVQMSVVSEPAVTSGTPPTSVTAWRRRVWVSSIQAMTSGHRGRSLIFGPSSRTSMRQPLALGNSSKPSSPPNAARIRPCAARAPASGPGWCRPAERRSARRGGCWSRSDGRPRPCVFSLRPALPSLAYLLPDGGPRPAGLRFIDLVEIDRIRNAKEHLVVERWADPRYQLGLAMRILRLAQPGHFGGVAMAGAASCPKPD
jgi:hypothetical protein